MLVVLVLNSSFLLLIMHQGLIVLHCHKVHVFWYTFKTLHQLYCDLGYTISALISSGQSVNPLVNRDMIFRQVKQICLKNRIHIRAKGKIVELDLKRLS